MSAAMERHNSASMVVIDPERGAVLLVHHKKINKWAFPGGHVDENEAPHEAAVREVKEETGVDARFWERETALPGCVSYPTPIVVAEFAVAPWGDAPEHRHVDFLYLGVTEAGDVRVQEDEAYDAVWVPVSDVVSGSFGGMVREEVSTVLFAVARVMAGGRA